MFILVIGFMLFSTTKPYYVAANTAHPFLMGFSKFFVLAPMGELLTSRIIFGKYILPCGFIYRMIVWGFIGMLITLMFYILPLGISASMEQGVLPGNGNKLIFALTTSIIANCAFAPIFMSFHAISDAFIELRIGKNKNITIIDAVRSIDWGNFVRFAIFKTLIFIWIPIHAITFLLPGEYRVLLAAVASVLLGIILAIPKRL